MFRRFFCVLFLSFSLLFLNSNLSYASSINVTGISTNVSNLSQSPTFTIVGTNLPTLSGASTASDGNTNYTNFALGNGSTSWGNSSADGIKLLQNTSTEIQFQLTSGLSNYTGWFHVYLTPSGVNAASIPVNQSYDFNIGTGQFLQPFDVAPTIVSSSVTASSVTFSWSPVTGSASYNIYRDGSLYSNVTSGTSYTDSGLSLGVTHSYSVTAVDPTGVESPQSSSVSLTTNNVPSAPTGLVATPGDTTASLTWNIASNTSSYNIYRDGSLIGTSTSNSYNDAGLTDGTTYTYYVTAVNNVGESAKSVSVSVTPQKVFTPVSNLSLVPGKTAIAVSWAGDNAPFTVAWSGNVSGSSTVSVNNFTITGLTANTDYTVTLTDAGGKVVSGTVNTGNQELLNQPVQPDSTSIYQTMINMFGTAGTYALYVIGAAVALGVIVILAIYTWRLLKRWLRSST